MKSFNIWSAFSSITVVLSVVTASSDLQYPFDCTTEKLLTAASECDLIMKTELTNQNNELVTINPVVITSYGPNTICHQVIDRIAKRCLYSDAVNYNGPCNGDNFLQHVSNCGLIASIRDKTIHDPASAVVPGKNIEEYLKSEPYNCWKNMDAIKFMCRDDYTYDDD